ncbi:F-box/kelch-repeat protein At3g23880-like [Camellia sinensis]|uniref:F-box/kelch-repeat protein At3g23880-like n=1 Tax=Camellia sinensis TaxID=4442 RepID=UPI00103668A5|nr:F-box/kelch-repeat protein At3g23880-like [Camellia sinensis]
MANQERNTESTDDAMSSSSDYNLSLPMDIIVDILNRLPVKSLVRFRCVCKTFRHLISNPTFISSHLLHHRTPTTAATIFTFKHRTTTSLSLLQSPSSSQNPVNLVHPWSNHTRNLHLIGSINGLLCLCLRLSNHPLYFHRRIILLLWNPATKLFKSLRSPTIQIPPTCFHLSLGFGFGFHSSTSSSDYKVVRIVSFNLRVRAEVYSAISNCWREIRGMDLHFYIHKLSCEAIVNGAPYWLLATPSNHCFRFAWFDFQNEAFVMLPGLDFSGFYFGTLVHWKLMDWKDNAAVVVLCPGNPFFDVWMIEDRCGGESNWCKKFVIGPVLGVEQFWVLQCTKNGEIIVAEAGGRVTPDVHFHKDLELNSLDNMQIVMALEEEFKLEIPDKEADKIDSCFLAIE